MNILDENILASERRLLAKWGVPFRQVSYELGKKGMGDEQIIPLLLTLPHSTFFTQDLDFYSENLCHAKYCLVFVDVRRTECAAFIRRVLRHPEFDTHAKRMGVVMRASQSGISAWRLHVERQENFDWTE